MASPVDLSRDVEAYTNAVYSSWPQFCQRARAAFADTNRGTFLIDLDQPFPSVDDIPYLTTDEASKALGLQDYRDTAIRSRVGTYNPEKELVVTFKSVARNHAECVVLGLPPAEFADIPIVTDRPDANAATTFDELIDTLNDIYFRSDVREMDAPGRHIWRVMEAKWGVQCDGFNGYFWNVGTDCCEVIEALSAIASPVLQRVFSSAFARFPNGQPSVDDDEFYTQLAEIGEADPVPFDANDSEFYDIVDQIPTILWTYWQSRRST